MHAMRNSSSQSKQQACKNMMDYIQSKMRDYINKITKWSQAVGKGQDGAYTETLQSQAFHSLGMALHAGMDFTSPAHSGFQVWKWTPSVMNRHGNFPGSLEGLDAAKNPAALAATLAAMKSVMSGEFLCECE